MQLLYGLQLSNKIKEDVKNEVITKGIKAKLSVILVGDDESSKVYVKAKEKALKECGMIGDMHYLDKDFSEKKLLNLIKKLNKDKTVSAILVQLPLPDHIDTFKVLSQIDKNKDVDGFGIYSMGRLCVGNTSLVACTPKGILTFLDHFNIKTEGKNIVVKGRSIIVGRPLSILLSQEPYNGTVSVVHSISENNDYLLKNADIIISAIGQENSLKASDCKNDVIIIDVGINKVKDESKKNGYRLVGDVDIDSFKNTDAIISAVPKGIGPLTIASLIQNTLNCAKGIDK